MCTPFPLLTHTLTLLGASSSLRLNPRIPKAESPTCHTPDKFIKWYSGVKQLELGASGEGPQTKKSLGNCTSLSSHPGEFSTWYPSGSWSNGVIWVWGILPLTGILHCLWAGWRFFPYLQRGSAAVSGWVNFLIFQLQLSPWGPPSLSLAGVQCKFTAFRWQIHSVRPRASVKLATNAKQLSYNNIYIYE